MLDLTFNNQTDDKTQTAGFYLKILGKAIQILKLKTERDIGLSLNLVGESSIRSLNAEHRNRNQLTDVLSFGLLPHPLYKCGGLEEKPVRAIMELGDIFICLPYVKKQAQKEGVNLEQKLALLTIHGLLHLLGYDHERSLWAKKKMFALQKKLLKNLATSN